MRQAGVGPRTQQLLFGWMSSRERQMLACGVGVRSQRVMPVECVGPSGSLDLRRGAEGSGN